MPVVDQLLLPKVISCLESKVETSFMAVMVAATELVAAKVIVFVPTERLVDEVIAAVGVRESIVVYVSYS